MAERRSVEADVAGSSPVFHPKHKPQLLNAVEVLCFIFGDMT